MKRLGWILTAVLLPLLSASALQPGDPAPPVKAALWLGGDAVNPAEPDGETLYVVEFWATWCPPCRKSIPHLNELHDRLKDRKVVFIGVTDEPEELVRPFAEKMEMRYRVAIDPDRETVDPYMESVAGIPHAFIVDREGRIAWSGHPLAGMDEALEGLLEGTYDMSKAQARQKREDDLQDLVVAGEYAKALTQVEELIREGGARMEYFQIQLGLLAQTGETARFPEVYRAMYEAFEDSADELSTLAWIASTSPFSLCDLATAWKAATRAAELTKSKEAPVLDVLARVYYALGMLEEAVATQEAAVGLAAGAEEDEDMAGSLAYYRSALEARRAASAPKTEP